MTFFLMKSLVPDILELFHGIISCFHGDIEMLEPRSSLAVLEESHSWIILFEFQQLVWIFNRLFYGVEDRRHPEYA